MFIHHNPTRESRCICKYAPGAVGRKICIRIAYKGIVKKPNDRPRFALAVHKEFTEVLNGQVPARDTLQYVPGLQAT